MVQAAKIQAILDLQEAGCHFVIVADPDEPKRPSWPPPDRADDPEKKGMGRKWQLMKPPLDLLLEDPDNLAA